MDSLEYRTLNNLYPELVVCIGQSPNDVADRLRPCGILAPADESFLANPANSNSDKARKITDVVLVQVQSKKQVYFQFVKAMKASGKWTRATVCKMENELSEESVSSVQTAEMDVDHDITLDQTARRIPYSTTPSSFSSSTPCEGNIETPLIQEQSQDSNCILQQHSLAASHSDAQSQPDQLSTQSPAVPLSNFSSQSVNSKNKSVTKSDGQQSQYSRFECGCEKCSVFDYISGKKCPNPKQLPFPRVEISQFRSEEIEYIEHALSRQTESIYREFTGLIMKTFKELREKVSHSDLISHLKVLLRPKHSSQQASQILNDLDKVSPSDLPYHLIDKYYCSWFDYDLIKYLRKEYLYPDEEGDEALVKYKELLRCYVNRRCFFYLHNTGPWPEGHVQINVKIDKEYSQLTQQLIECVKHTFLETIEEPSFHLSFMKAQKGCTELIFVASPYFSEINLTKYQITQLKEHGFLKITIGEKELLQSEDSGQEPAPQDAENRPPQSATDPPAWCCDDADKVNNQEEEGVQNTLDDLMVETGATLADLGKECVDNHLVKIATKFTSVESLGGCLKLEDMEIAEVSRRQDLSLQFQIKAILMKWKKKFGRKATYRWLVEMSLEEFSNANTAELICKLSKETVPQEMEDQWPSGGKAKRALLFLCIGFLSILVPLSLMSTGGTLWAQKQYARPLDKAPAPPLPHTPIQAPPPHSSQAPGPSSKHSPHTGVLTGTVIRRGDRPKMPQLRSFKLRNGETIDIVTQIGTQYRKFGQLLLEHSNEVDIHEASCHHRPTCIVDRMLGGWLSGQGRLPVTWETFVSTLDEADMRILALDIRGQYSSKDEL